MDYTKTIVKGTYDLPMGSFDQNGRVVYNDYEHYDIDVIDVVMQSNIESDKDIWNLAEELYPEIISVMGENEYVGVRITFERPIKTILRQGDKLDDFQRCLRRQYSDMRLDIDVFGLGKED